MGVVHWIQVTSVGERAADRIDLVAEKSGFRGDQVDDLADALAGQVCLNEQRQSVGKIEALTEDVHADGAAGQAALAVVEPVGLDAVPEGRDGVLRGVGESGADLEGNLDAVGRDGADQRSGGDRGAEDLALNDGRGRERGGGLVVDQSRHADKRAALRGGQERRLGGDTILQIAKLVGYGGERLHEHDAEVGLRSLLPCGVALRGKL